MLVNGAPVLHKNINNHYYIVVYSVLKWEVIRTGSFYDTFGCFLTMLASMINDKCGFRNMQAIEDSKKK